MIYMRSGHNPCQEVPLDLVAHRATIWLRSVAGAFVRDAKFQERGFHRGLRAGGSLSRDIVIVYETSEEVSRRLRICKVDDQNRQR